jgi:hypothetical protein
MYSWVRHTPAMKSGAAESRRGRSIAPAACAVRQRASQRAHDLGAQGAPLGLRSGVQQRDAARQVVEYQERLRRDVMHAPAQPFAVGRRPGRRSKNRTTS